MPESVDFAMVGQNCLIKEFVAAVLLFLVRWFTLLRDENANDLQTKTIISAQQCINTISYLISSQYHQSHNETEKVLIFLIFLYLNRNRLSGTAAIITQK